MSTRRIRLDLTRSLASLMMLAHLFFFCSSAPTLARAATYPPDGPYSPGTVPSLARPNYLVPVTDPVWGTKITRITDAAAFGQSNVRHDYSKVQPWNSDQTLVRIKKWILDGTTYRILRTIPVPSELRWSFTDPNKLYAVSANSFVSVNASTGAITTLRTFAGYSSIAIGPWEGNLSTDDSKVALLANNNTVIVYNIATDRIISTKTLSTLGYSGTIDWVSMSQSGNYVVINGRGSSDNSVSSYDLNLNKVATLFAIGEHADLGYDASGNEVLVQMCPTQIARLSNGQKTSLNPSYCGHISTRSYNRPGWGYANFSTGSPQDVLAIKLDGSGTVERFVHHRSTQAVYDAQAQSVVSPDGAKVMFASDLEWYG